MVSISRKKQEAAAELDRAEVRNTLGSISASLYTFERYASIDSALRISMSSLGNSIDKVLEESAADAYPEEALRSSLRSIMGILVCIKDGCEERKSDVYKYSMRVRNDAENPYTEPASRLRSDAEAIGRLLRKKK